MNNSIFNQETLGTAENNVETAYMEQRKVKVVFFPYKASMWDALESVWIAAKNDPRCETAVVPIPYADRAKDGSALKIHCDRDFFPDYVPITRFEEYDVSFEKPDIAYIHNPYDGNNTITSVEPKYYSHRLKEHVGTLVYIPYYASQWDTIGMRMRIACATAVDVIVARDDNDAKAYRETAPEKDVAALGSPKIDRILKYEKEKPEMPAIWKRNLSGKRVFLLNTSVSSLCFHGESFNEKINSIFSVFEGRDDIALIWRPHPLSESMMNSISEELAEGHKKLANRIKTGNFGVLDDTVDVNRAIALSDAYLGEGASSMVYMYAVTGKPVYVMDSDITRETNREERHELLRSAIISELIFEEGGQTVLGVNTETNEICRVDLKTGRISTAAEIPCISDCDINPFIVIADCEDKYILPPYNSGCFVELDRDLKFIRSVEIPERARAGQVFGQSVRHGKYVYFIPVKSQAIARYRIDTGEYEYFYDWYERFKQYAQPKDSVIFHGYHCLTGDKLYLPCRVDNIIAEVRLDSLDIKIRRIGGKDKRYYSLAFDGRYLWLTRFRQPEIENFQWKDSVTRWDVKTGKTEEFEKLPRGFKCENMGFGRIEILGKQLIVFPQDANMILRINTKTGKIEELCPGAVADPKNTDNILLDPKGNILGIVAPLTDRKTIIGLMMRERAIITINTETGEYLKLPLRYDDEHQETKRSDPRRFISPEFDVINRGIYFERTLFPARRFIEAVLSGGIPPKNGEQAAYYLNMASNHDGQCGLAIHEYVMKKNMSLHDRN